MEDVLREGIGTRLFQVRDTRTRITFEQRDKGTFLTEIVADNGDNFLKRPTLLWEIELTEKSKLHATLDMAGICPTKKERNGYHVFHWPTVPIGETDQFVNVEVTIKFLESGQVEWRINVTDVPASWSIFRVRFPVMELAAAPTDDYAMVIPMDWGARYRNPLATLPSGGWFEELRKRPYPHDAFCMQFVALERGKDMLYFAAHDPKPVTKTVYLGPDKENELIYLKPYVDTLIEFGRDYEQSFAWITFCTQGDWYDASQIYRQFARKASWTSRGTLQAGKKTPKWFQDIPLVGLRLYRGPEYTESNLMAEKKYFGHPMVYFYCMWQQSAFDARNPLFFPAVPGFKKTVEELKKHDIFIMPYINTYTADTTTEEFRSGLKAAALVINEDGDFKTETYSQGNLFAVMCQSSPMWRYTAYMTAMRLVDSGVKAIYHDQLAMSGPWPCYGTDHGHIPGGGSNIVDGQRQFLKQIHDESFAETGEIVQTAEGCAEPYIEYVDSCLVGMHNCPYYVPLFPAVYHDYVMNFGRFTFTPELTDSRFKDAIIAKHAMTFIWGAQFGWSRVPLSAIIEKAPATAEFLRHLGYTRIFNADYMVRGKMLRPLDLSGQLKSTKISWTRSATDDIGTTVDMCPVLNSVWQAYDGSIAVVLVNITEEPISLKIRMKAPNNIIADRVNRINVSDEYDGDDAVRKAAICTNHYPLGEKSIGQLRIVDGTDLQTSIADGDSHKGYNIQVPGLKCVVLALGSEKSYGVHEFTH